MRKKAHIIGSGFSSLATSCYLAKHGFEVTVFEQNKHIGGRARQLYKEGFTFDMGPTWYWMPDVFERFFADFSKSPTEYYHLEKLDPGYGVYFGKNNVITIGDELSKIYDAFEKVEAGSSIKLKKFIDKARDNYNIAIKELVYKPGVSPLELMNTKTLTRLHLFINTIKSDIRKEFTDSRLIQILEFPVLFLGAKPADTPSFYSFMNYADFGLGTWYPTGGMNSVVQGIKDLATTLGVTFRTNASVEKIEVNNGTATGLWVNGESHSSDFIISGADYHHTETLLDKKNRQYTEEYWNKKTFAPSALLFYLGFNKKVENVFHHTLFFDVDFDAHAHDIYDKANWPEDPLFYASFPSKTDITTAPEGCESAIILVPLAPGLSDTPEERELCFDKIMKRLEHITEQNLSNHIILKESFCITDFINDYNSYKGNAYGLANTLMQTAFLRPKLQSKKVKNLFFTGQLTVPGPGVPPALISGKLVSELVIKQSNK